MSAGVTGCDKDEFAGFDLLPDKAERIRVCLGGEQQKMLCAVVCIGDLIVVIQDDQTVFHMLDGFFFCQFYRIKKFVSLDQLFPKDRTDNISRHRRIVAAGKFEKKCQKSQDTWYQHEDQKKNLFVDKSGVVQHGKAYTRKKHVDKIKGKKGSIQVID